jgi:hypothetical protein
MQNLNLAFQQVRQPFTSRQLFNYIRCLDIVVDTSSVLNIPSAPSNYNGSGAVAEIDPLEALRARLEALNQPSKPDF